MMLLGLSTCPWQDSSALDGSITLYRVAKLTVLSEDMSLPEAVSRSAFEEPPELPRNSLEIIGPPRRKGPQRALTPNPAMADPLLTVEDVGRRAQREQGLGLGSLLAKEPETSGNPHGGWSSAIPRKRYRSVHQRAGKTFS
jgi:hypothetical protein